MNKSYKHNVKQKKPDEKDIYYIWVYLYKVQKQAKHFNYVRSQDKTVGNGQKEAKWSRGGCFCIIITFLKNF